MSDWEKTGIWALSLISGMETGEVGVGVWTKGETGVQVGVGS